MKASCSDWVAPSILTLSARATEQDHSPEPKGGDNPNAHHTNGCMNPREYVYLCGGIVFSHKKEQSTDTRNISGNR